MILELYLTTRCNFLCEGCCGGVGCVQEHFSLEEIYKEIDAIAGIVRDGDDFNLLGGEPCLHPQFREIVEYCGKAGFKTSRRTVWSNGTIFSVLKNDETVEIMREAGFTHIGLTDYQKENNLISDCVQRCEEIGFTSYVNCDLRRFHLFDTNRYKKEILFPLENKSKEKIFQACFRQKMCHCVAHGKLFRCPSMRVLYHAIQNGWTHNTGDLCREGDAWFDLSQGETFREAVKNFGECCRVCPEFWGTGLHETRRIEEKGLATKQNTSFVTVAAYPDYENITSLLTSARANDVFLTVVDFKKPWENFYQNKVLARKHHLEEEKRKGKKWVFLLDSRDVIFLTGISEILRKYNEIKDIHRALFVAEYCGDTWPLMEPWFSDIVHAVSGKREALNSGLIAGHIDTLLDINEKAIQIHDEFEQENFTHRICEIVHEKIGNRHIDDDQFLYNLVYIIWPHLFQIDTDKKLFANTYLCHPFDLTRTDEDIREARIIQASGARFRGGFVSLQKVTADVPEFHGELWEKTKNE